jgi:hypothetical protein
MGTASDFAGQPQHHKAASQKQSLSESQSQKHDKRRKTHESLHPLLSFRDMEQQISPLLWLREKKRNLLQKAHSEMPGHGRPSGLMLLDGFQVGENRRDFIGIEDKFGHIRMADGKALGQCLTQLLNTIPA